MKKTYKFSEQARRNMSEAAKRRPSKLVSTYGFTEEFVKAQFASGNSWCSDCKRFLPVAEFGNQKYKRRCKSCTSAWNKRTYERETPQMRKQRRDSFKETQPERFAHAAKKNGFARYGITHEWYAQKLREQGGGCALCGRMVPNKGKKYFSIDHRHGCHCNKFKGKGACDKCRRGLLCARCNFSLERIESIPGWMDNTAAYLRKYGHS